VPGFQISFFWGCPFYAEFERSIMQKISLKAGFGILLILGSIVLFGCTSAQELQKEIVAENAKPDLRRIFERYRVSVPQFMHDNDIPGLSLAVVDRKTILWAAGFGTTDTDRKTPVTPDTLYSIQSISKSITATLLMIAANDKILGLDAPIARAVPGFTVQSRFEKAPQDLITLRTLLLNTSGLAMEAPVGNNVDPRSPSFKEHIRSISETWLKHRVGERYSYSNLGYDLAAFAIQSASNMPFDRYAKVKLFIPAGMNRSTFNQETTSATPNKAIGHSREFSLIPTSFPMLGAGGAWTTANDLARFVQFHLNHGAVNGRQLLEPRFLNSMYLLPPTWSDHTYAMGLSVVKRNGSYFLNHSGGGFGFYATMSFYPELGIGCVALTNSVDHGGAQAGLVDSILDSLISTGQIDKTGSAGFPSIESIFEKYPMSAPVFEPQGKLGTPWRPEFKQYAGSYRYIWSEFRFPALHSFFAGADVTIGECKGRLCVNNEVIEEYRPGLFFTESGETLDFTHNPPRWKNISLAYSH
jgi:CubicO group peptidase (beta-lactamase class C family)